MTCRILPPLEVVLFITASLLRPCIAAETQPGSSAHEVPAVEIIGLDIDHSDELLRTFFGKIEENRQKLKTVHIAAEASLEEFDATKGEWRQTNCERGEGWMEAADPRRGRVEISFCRSPWENGAAPFFESSFTEVWNGEQILHLEHYKGDPNPTASTRAGPGWDNGILGTSASTQLAWELAMRDGQLVRNSYRFSPEALKDKILHIRRVILKGDVLAWELTEEFPPAPNGWEPPEGHQISKFWFDDARGMATLAFEETNGGRPHIRVAVTEIAEGAPAIFWPKATRAMMWRSDGTPRNYSTFKATSVKLNDPIPEEKLQLPSPANAER